MTLSPFGGGGIHMPGPANVKHFGNNHHKQGSWTTCGTAASYCRQLYQECVLHGFEVVKHQR